jgi:membrane-anchored mycosin MYCP
VAPPVYRRMPLAALCCLVAAVPLLTVGVPSVDAATLPQVTQQLTPGQPCLTGSGITVSGIAWPALASDLERAWPLSQGAGTTVAVLDTGVASGGVPQLAGQVTSGHTVAGPANADCVGHGTFVAGLIAARPDSATGFSGVAPGSHVFALAVTNATGATSADVLANGIDVAVARGARVIDVSIATPTLSPHLTEAVRDAIAAGSLVVAPATIDGQSESGPVYPAACPGVLSVADVGGNGGSTPGAQAVGAPVDVVAPGDGIVGVGIGGSGFGASGASYATAFVAGAAALIESYRGGLTPPELVHRIEATAVHPGTSLPDPRLGYGEVDPLAALSTVLTGQSGQPVSPTAVTAGNSPVVVPPSLRHPARTTALLIGGASAVTVAFVGLAMLTAVARRRRDNAATGVIRPDRSGAGDLASETT